MKFSLGRLWVAWVAALLLSGVVTRGGESVFSGISVQWAWDLGSGYNSSGHPSPAPDGTELWGTYATNGFEPLWPWRSLEDNGGTNDIRFLLADTEDGLATNAWTKIQPGTMFTAAYAYVVNPGYTNVWTNYDSNGVPTTVTNVVDPIRIRSEPSNIVQIEVASPVRNLRLMSTENIEGPWVVTATNEVNLAGSSEKFFRMILVPE